MSDGQISPHEAAELAVCFRTHARDLFGYACMLTRGDQARAEDLVQAAFEAAGQAWPVLEYLAEDRRRDWLQRTLANIAVDGFRRETALRDRLPRIEARSRKIQADPPGQAPHEQAPPGRPLTSGRCHRSRWNGAGGSSRACRNASTWSPCCAGSLT